MTVSTEGGTVKVGDATATIDDDFSEDYGMITDVILTAEPAEGYEFDYYIINGNKTGNPSITLEVDCAMQVYAHFKVPAPDSGDDDDEGGGGCFIGGAAHRPDPYHPLPIRLRCPGNI